MVLKCKNGLWRVYATRWVGLGLWGRCVYAKTAYMHAKTAYYMHAKHVRTSYHIYAKVHFNTTSFHFYLAYYLNVLTCSKAQWWKLLQPSVLQSAPNRSNINSYFVSRLLDDLCSGFFCFVLVPARPCGWYHLEEESQQRLHCDPKKCLET